MKCNINYSVTLDSKIMFKAIFSICYVKLKRMKNTTMNKENIYRTVFNLNLYYELP